MKRVIVFLFIFVGIVLFLDAEGAPDVDQEGFEYTGIDRLRVERGSIFDIEITGGPGSATMAKISNPRKDRMRVKHSLSGSELKVWVEGRGPMWGPNIGRFAIFFTVPERIELVIETSTGDVQIDSCTGLKDIHTSTGDISVQNGFGDLQSRSSTGDQIIRDIDGDIDTRSSTGTMTFENITGNITAESTTGDFRIDGLDGTIDLQSTTGDQDGKGIRLADDSSFKSSTGNIKMAFLNSDSDLKYDLRSSSGTLRAGSSRGNKTLVIGEGSILITGRSSTGDQKYE